MLWNTCNDKDGPGVAGTEEDEEMRQAGRASTEWDSGKTDLKE
jgi:hypothetical protein